MNRMKIIVQYPDLKKKDIRDFLNQYPIKTGGAISKHEISIEEKEVGHGDVYYQLTIPFWSQNACVVDSVLKLLLAIRKKFNDNSIYIRDGRIIVQIYTSICDPD